MVTRIGPFDLYELVGRGGMGSVYRGVDPVIGRPVAIKVIRLVGYNNAQEAAFLKDRLFKEARAAGRLSHPGIVTIYQVGVEEELAFIAMEYVEGPTLETRLASAGPLESDLLSRVLLGAAAALDYAHGRAVIHRDVKPSNIMFAGDGRTKITDFGIAKTMLGHTATSTGMLLGTPYYMSPEQVQGKNLDGRSDQFALAVIAYEVLTRRRPFHAEQVTSICYQIVHAEPVSPADLNPELSAGVSEVLRRALAKDPADRYTTCMQFATELIAEYQKVLQLRQCTTRESLAPPLSKQDNTGLPDSKTEREESLSSRPQRKQGLAGRLLGWAALAAAIALITAVLLIGRLPEKLPAAVSKQSVGTPSTNNPQSPNVQSPPNPFDGFPETVKAIRQTLPARKPTASVPLPLAEAPSRLVVNLEPTEAAAGRLIWTGRAMPGTLLKIENGHASDGLVIGRLPGKPVTIKVFPAAAGPDGLLVFTTDPQYATPRQQRTSAGEITLLWDPRHSTDLLVWETPALDNGWGTIVLQLNNAGLTGCLIEWATATHVRPAQ